MIKTVIVDDDSLLRLTLKKYIGKTSNLEFVADFENPIDAVEYLKKNKVDLIFLDIEMPEMNGFDVLKKIKVPHVVITSYKKEYAADAFDYDVIDFLSKPVSYERFMNAVLKVENSINSVKLEDENVDSFYIRDGGKVIKLILSKISYIEAIGDYVKFYYDGTRYTVLSTMKNIELKLSKYNFFRIHRSYIVNLDKVSKVEENKVFVDEVELPVSRAYKAELLNKMHML